MKVGLPEGDARLLKGRASRCVATEQAVYCGFLGKKGKVGIRITECLTAMTRTYPQASLNEHIRRERTSN
jgi:hypothetical protein